MSNEKLKAPLAIKHKITIAAQRRERTRERDEENESNAVRCYNKRPCWVVDEERERDRESKRG